MAQQEESLVRLKKQLEAEKVDVVVAVSTDEDSHALEISSRTESRRLVRVTTQNPEAERYDYIGFVPEGSAGRRPIGWGKNVTADQLLDVVRRIG